jgi:hypothetical protein
MSESQKGEVKGTWTPTQDKQEKINKILREVSCLDWTGASFPFSFSSLIKHIDQSQLNPYMSTEADLLQELIGPWSSSRCNKDMVLSYKLKMIPPDIYAKEKEYKRTKGPGGENRLPAGRKRVISIGPKIVLCVTLKQTRKKNRAGRLLLFASSCSTPLLMSHGVLLAQYI